MLAAVDVSAGPSGLLAAAALSCSSCIARAYISRIILSFASSVDDSFELPADCSSVIRCDTMSTQIHAWMFNTHLSDVCDTAGVHVFEHLELALIVDDERSGAGLLWLRVGHIVVTCLVDASRVMFQVQ